MSRASLPARSGPRLLACLLVYLPACQQGMRDQPRVDPLEEPVPRESPPGVVPRGHARLDAHLWAGRDPDGAPVTRYPFAIAREDLRRGEQRYHILCAPCHGRLGDGDGMVVRRGYPAPPAFTTAAVRDASPGALFDAITRGRARMPNYAHIAPADRWRIVAWVEVLRLSQRAPADLLRPDERARFAPGAAP